MASDAGQYADRSKGLEILIRSFYKDYFPNVEWLQTLANTPIERQPNRHP